MKRVAALDCGTNTLRLLVADLDAETGQARVLDRRTTIVRLGQDVDRTGVFASAALARTFATLDDYVSIVRQHRVDVVRFVATSAARDVQNRGAFVDGVRDRLGVEPDIIPGDEEARLAYDGATRQLAGRPDVPRPLLVLDIGGGSTELVLGDEASSAIRGVSLDVGSVRLTERHLHGDPPTTREVAAATANARAGVALAGESVPMTAAGTLVGLAGSVTTVAALALRLPAYDPARIQHARIGYDRVAEVTEMLLRATRGERAALPVMHPGRVDVIGAGALVLRTVMEEVGAESVVASEHDILDGIADSLR